ncbi:MAG: mechanosensitive ion channel family protein [Deltaproteobacteria bacterium]|nr:mechanosensitive ion channel family protein [Deltaproteobacteria bacterium]
MIEQLNVIISKLDKITGLESGPLHTTLKAIIAIIISYIAWLLLKQILHHVEKRLKKYEIIRINAQLFVIVRKLFYYALIMITGTYLIRLFNIELIENFFLALLMILMAFPLNNFLTISINYLEKQVASNTETKIDDILFDLLKKFSSIIFFVIVIIMALDVLGVNIMPFIAGAGVAGIAIGFAAKDTLSNLIAGILLIIDRPFEVGDRIEIWSAPAGSATWGDVIDVGLRATKIKTTDNIIIIIPNNEIMTRDIVNYTIITSKIRVRINVGVAYDSDIKKTRKVLLMVADAVPWVAKEPEPKVVVRNFGDSSVDLQLRVWIDDARKRMDTISYITDKIKDAFEEHDIEIPFPKRDITIIHKKGEE